MRGHAFAQPPQALRCPGVRSDNLAIVPATLLPFKAKWQEVANSLPQGEMLIILPAGNTPSRKILDRVVVLLEARGHRVAALPAERFA